MSWHAIPNTNGLYEITKTGRVRSRDRYVRSRHGMVLKKGRILKPIADGPYIKYSLSLPGLKQKRYYLHKLLALTFIPNPKDKKHANHKDGNKRNNRLSNLEWATKSEDAQHARDTGLVPTGVNHPRAKLTEQDVACIRYDIETSNQSMSEIGRKYGVHAKTVCNIRDGKIWTRVGSTGR